MGHIEEAGLWPFYLAACERIETKRNETEAQRTGMGRMVGCSFVALEEPPCGTVGT